VAFKLVGVQLADYGKVSSTDQTQGNLLTVKSSKDFPAPQVFSKSLSTVPSANAKDVVRNLNATCPQASVSACYLDRLTLYTNASNIRFSISGNMVYSYLLTQEQMGTPSFKKSEYVLGIYIMPGHTLTLDFTAETPVVYATADVVNNNVAAISEAIFVGQSGVMISPEVIMGDNTCESILQNLVSCKG
jgi:hypothetical protein